MHSRALITTLCASLALASSPIHGRHAQHHHIIQERQGTVSGSSTHAPTGTSTGAPTGNPSGTPSGNPTGSPSATPTGPAVPIVTAPGAIPLESILPSPATGPAVVPYPTFAAGAKPSGLANAPALPSLTGWNGYAYPHQDKVPPTDSDEVVQWIQQVRDSGVVIPDIKPHVNADNMCSEPANAPRVRNETECWWSCGHCVRKTDIVECQKNKAWGSSFDDGPSPESGRILKYLGDNHLSTTFFVVGSRVSGAPALLQAEYLAGHQIGVHTWSHTALTTQSTEQVIAELGWTKQVIKDAIGVTPLTFRPPYGDIDDRVRAIGRAMNLTAVMWTTTGDIVHPISFDTFDGQVVLGEATAVQSVNQFASLLQTADSYGHGFIVLEHDLWWQQAQLAASYFLPTAVSRGFAISNIAQCMSQNLADSYAETAASGKTMPGGSNLGADITASSQRAPPNAPLGGSDGSNTDPNVKAGDGKSGDNGQGSARALWSSWSAAAGVGLAALVSAAAAL